MALGRPGPSSIPGLGRRSIMCVLCLFFYFQPGEHLGPLPPRCFRSRLRNEGRRDPGYDMHVYRSQHSARRQEGQLFLAFRHFWCVVQRIFIIIFSTHTMVAYCKLRNQSDVRVPKSMQTLLTSPGVIRNASAWVTVERGAGRDGKYGE